MGSDTPMAEECGGFDRSRRWGLHPSRTQARVFWRPESRSGGFAQVRPDHRASSTAAGRGPFRTSRSGDKPAVDKLDDAVAAAG